MSREDTPTLDVDLIVTEWVSKLKRFSGKTVANFDVNDLELKETKTINFGKPDILHKLQANQIQVVYSPQHKNRTTKLKMMLSRVKKTEITVCRGGVRGLNRYIVLKGNDKDYSLNVCEDFFENREQLGPIRIKDIDIPEIFFNKTYAHAIVTPIQLHSCKTFVKKLELTGYVRFGFTDRRPVSVNIGVIVSDLQQVYRMSCPDLSMLTVSKTGAVVWEMELKVKQKWEVDARVTFPYFNN